MNPPSEDKDLREKNIVPTENPNDAQTLTEKEVHEVDHRHEIEPEALVNEDDHSDASTISEAVNNNGENDGDRDLEGSSEVVRRITTELGPPITIPRLKRRGLFAQLAIIPEIENGKTYPRRTKWYITAIAAVGGVAAPLGSAIFLPSLHQVATDLNSTPTIVNLSIALYMLAMSIFPLWWSSFSEAFGRRSIYIVSFALFALFNVLGAISHSIGMLIVMRLLAGGASVSFQFLRIAEGFIADRHLGICSSCWRWHNSRYLGDQRARPGNGLFLPWASLRTTIRAYHWRCIGRKMGLAIYHVVHGHLRWYRLDSHPVRIARNVGGAKESHSTIGSSHGNSSGKKHQPRILQSRTKQCKGLEDPENNAC